MKKVSFYVMLVMAGAILATGCKKEDDVTPTPNDPAIIKGVAFAELDLTKPGLEMVPAGTVITALIDPRDLMVDPDSTLVTDNMKVTTTVGTGGAYELSLRALNSSTPVQVIADDFAYNQIQDSLGTTVRKVYQANSFTTNVVSGTTTIIDITYN
jgi:hypothetical protein